MKKQIEETVVKTVRAEALKKVSPDKAKILADGSEECDSQRLFEEVPFKKQVSLNERIRQITLQVQAETAARLAAQRMTPEEVKRILDEEDDYNIPDDLENALTVYERMGIVSDLKDDIVGIEPVPADLLDDPETVSNEPPAPENPA